MKLTLLDQPSSEIPEPHTLLYLRHLSRTEELPPTPFHFGIKPQPKNLGSRSLQTLQSDFVT